MTPTTRPTLDYETEPTTRAGLSLVSTYTILTPFVVAIETEAREALAAELAALREALRGMFPNGFYRPGHWSCDNAIAAAIARAAREGAPDVRLPDRHTDPLTGKDNPETWRRDPLTGEWH